MSIPCGIGGRQSTDPACGNISTTAQPQWFFEEDGWVFIKGQDGRASQDSVELPSLNRSGNAAGTDATCGNPCHVHCSVSTILPQQILARSVGQYTDGPQYSHHVDIKACSDSQAALSQWQTACEQFMAIASSAYSSTSDFNTAVCERDSSSLVSQTKLDAVRQIASRNQSLLHERWRLLCQEAQSLYHRVPCCETSFDDCASAISDSSSNAPVDVHEYFRLCREGFLLKEQISELTLDYAASVEPTSGGSTLQAAEVLESKRAALVSALEHIQQETEAQREACLARGLNPERFRHRRVSSHPSKHSAVTEWLDRDVEDQSTEKSVLME